MKALEKRRSIRKWKDTPISEQELSNLLWSACGITKNKYGKVKSKRTAPSACNSQEIRVYVLMETGVFLYNEENHELIEIIPKDIRENIGTQILKEQSMELGAFSISLAVKDIHKSRAFYQKLGFKVFGGDISQNWLILKNGDHLIGLFQGMFEKNILTFNPGWDSNARQLDNFTDVRELQRQLKAQGVEFESEADETTTGPASFVVVDPDGNPILVDQHV